MAIDNLAELTTTLHSALEKSQAAIEAAQAGMEKAKGLVEEAEKKSSKLKSKIDAAQTGFAAAPPKNEADRTRQGAEIRTLQAGLRDNEIELAKLREEQARLVAENGEEEARKDIGKAKSAFLERAAALFRKCNDASVRLIFAETAIRACRTYGVGPDSFESFADRKAAGETIDGFDRAIAETAADARTEAERMMEMHAVVEQLKAGRSGYLSAKERALATQSNLQTELAARKAESAEANSPEPADAARRRRTLSYVLIPGGVILLILAIVFGAVRQQDTAVLLLGLLAAVVAFYFAWRTSDARRGSRIESARRRLDAADAALRESEGDEKQIEASAESAAAALEKRILALTEVGPAPPAESPADRFAHLLGIAKKWAEEWASRHDQIRLVWP
jgi:hypothetical protein